MLDQNGPPKIPCDNWKKKHYDKWYNLSSFINRILLTPVWITAILSFKWKICERKVEHNITLFNHVVMISSIGSPTLAHQRDHWLSCPFGWPMSGVLLLVQSWWSNWWTINLSASGPFGGPKLVGHFMCQRQWSIWWFLVVGPVGDPFHRPSGHEVSRPLLCQI